MDKIKAIENIFLESLDKLDSKDKLRNNKDILFKLFSESNVFSFLAGLQETDIKIESDLNIIDIFISSIYNREEATLLRVAFDRPNIQDVDIILIGLRNIENWDSFSISMPSKDKRSSFEYQLKILEEYLDKNKHSNLYNKFIHLCTTKSVKDDGINRAAPILGQLIEDKFKGLEYDLDINVSEINSLQHLTVIFNFNKDITLRWKLIEKRIGLGSFTIDGSDKTYSPDTIGLKIKELLNGLD